MGSEFFLPVSSFHSRISVFRQTGIGQRTASLILLKLKDIPASFDVVRAPILGSELSTVNYRLYSSICQYISADRSFLGAQWRELMVELGVWLFRTQKAADTKIVGSC